MVRSRGLKQRAIWIADLLWSDRFYFEAKTLGAIVEFQRGKQREKFALLKQICPSLFNQSGPKASRLALEPWLKGQQFVGGPDLDGLTSLRQFVSGAGETKDIRCLTRRLELGLRHQRHSHQWKRGHGWQAGSAQILWSDASR